MPYEVDLSADRKLNCWWLTGQVVTDDVLSAMVEMARHPEFTPDRNTIVYIDETADLSVFDIAEFRRAMTQVKDTHKSIRGDVSIRCAIINADVTSRRILSLWQALTSAGEKIGVEYQVFASEAEALPWLSETAD